jgi:hypothetical protein
MSHWPLPDAQTLIALGLGLAAALHVLRRWWPQWAGLLAKRPAGGPVAQAACGSASTGSADAGAGCAAGCGQCGSAAPTATKDHRVHIVRRTPPR